ncbi:MAG: beta-ketoacyl synthase N-terminal-like domain-containing protein, partial [Acidobacteriota bacterium]
MSGRFPGARNIDEFWDNLIHGRESISEFTDEEVVEGVLEYGHPMTIPHLLEKFYGSSVVKKNGVLEGIDLFDAVFFDTPPKEAELLDPQQRVFLECSSEVLELAG